jgi:DNA-directed RNA polymerase specialized sigma54-like protein
MWMQQRVSLKLSQKPVLTQSLRQLVKLLALNKLELKAEINQELTENPVLEITSEIDGDRDPEVNLEEEAWAEEHGSNPADRDVLEAAGLLPSNGKVAAETDGKAADASPTVEERPESSKT